MTLGELIAHIAKAGQKLQRANPDMTIDEFHAIPIVVRENGRDVVRGLVSASIGQDHGNDGLCLALEIDDGIPPAEGVKP